MVEANCTYHLNMVMVQTNEVGHMGFQQTGGFHNHTGNLIPQRMTSCKEEEMNHMEARSGTLTKAHQNPHNQLLKSNREGHVETFQEISCCGQLV